MHHEHAVTENYVDRYLRNELGPDQAEAFEHHFLACADCQDELGAAQRLRDGLSDLVESGELDNPAQTTHVPWWRSATWAAAATVLLTVSLATSSVLVQKQRRLASLAASAAEVFPLVTVRSASGPPVNVISVNEATGMLVLMTDTGDINGSGVYTATLTSETGSADAIVFKQLRPAAGEKLALAIAANRLKSGDYRIEIRKEGELSVLNEIRFRLASE